MTREEYEFMRGARATVRTVQVSAGQVTELVGSSPNRIALLLFSEAVDYSVGAGPAMTERFVVRANTPPVELLLEHIGDLVQQPLWVQSPNTGVVSLVETVLG